MEISVLQSLIDRTSNQIAEYEGCYEFEKNLQKYNHLSDFEMEQSKYAAQYFKSRIPKLVEIQKELKKEIAGKIRLERGINHIRKMKEILQEED